MLRGGIIDTEGSTDGVMAGSWGSFDKHWNSEVASEVDRREEGVSTHFNGTNPFHLLLGTEGSPFSSYSWFRARTRRSIRTKHANCRPKDGQSDQKTFSDEHIWARCCVDGGSDFGSIYCPEFYGT